MNCLWYPTFSFDVSVYDWTYSKLILCYIISDVMNMLLVCLIMQSALVVCFHSLLQVYRTITYANPNARVLLYFLTNRELILHNIPVLHFQGNSVSTTKYSVLTFLPKGLFEQVFICCFLLLTLSIDKYSVEICNSFSFALTVQAGGKSLLSHDFNLIDYTN